MGLLDKALKELKEMDFAFGGSQGPDEGTAGCGGEVGVEDAGKLVSYQRLRNQAEEEEDDEGKDIVSMDMSFMIRILELVRENIESDEDLHHVASKLLELSREGGPLTMDHYGEFREFEGEGEEDMEADMEPDMEGGDEYPNPEEDQALEADPEADMEEDNEDIYGTGPISVSDLLAAAKRGR